MSREKKRGDALSGGIGGLSGYLAVGRVQAARQANKDAKYNDEVAHNRSNLAGEAGRDAAMSQKISRANAGFVESALYNPQRPGETRTPTERAEHYRAMTNSWAGRARASAQDAQKWHKGVKEAKDAAAQMRALRNGHALVAGGIAGVGVGVGAAAGHALNRWDESKHHRSHGQFAKYRRHLTITPEQARQAGVMSQVGSSAGAIAGTVVGTAAAIKSKGKTGAATGAGLGGAVGASIGGGAGAAMGIRSGKKAVVRKVSDNTQRKVANGLNGVNAVADAGAIATGAKLFRSAKKTGTGLKSTLKYAGEKSALPLAVGGITAAAVNTHLINKPKKESPVTKNLDLDEVFAKARNGTPVTNAVQTGGLVAGGAYGVAAGHKAIQGGLARRKAWEARGAEYKNLSSESKYAFKAARTAGKYGAVAAGVGVGATMLKENGVSKTAPGPKADEPAQVAEIFGKARSYDENKHHRSHDGKFTAMNSSGAPNRVPIKDRSGRETGLAMHRVASNKDALNSAWAGHKFGTRASNTYSGALGGGLATVAGLAAAAKHKPKLAEKLIPGGNAAPHLTAATLAGGVAGNLGTKAYYNHNEDAKKHKFQSKQDRRDTYALMYDTKVGAKSK